MAYNAALGFDPDKDYSAALTNANLSSAERAQLEKERSAKINKIYGGTEPTLAGSALTYSQAYNADGTKKQSTPSSTVSTTTPYSELNYYSTTTVDGTKETDWSKLISNAILDGKPASVVQGYLDQRNAKISSDPSLSQYANDELSQLAQKYIDEHSNDSDSMIDSLKGLYVGSGSAYANALKSSNAATDAAVEKAINELQAQKASTNQSYADLFRQLYIDKMKSKKNINQQLASQGITGGMSESSLLGLDTSYSEALRQGEESRINTLVGLDRAITDTKLDGDISKATAALESAQKSTDTYASILQSLISRNDTLDYNNRATERENDAIAREQENNEKANARSWAIAMIQSGVMPQPDVLLAAEINSADAQAMVDSVKAQQKSASSIASTMSLTDARNALEAGYIDDNIRTVLKNNGWSDEYIDYTYENVKRGYSITPEELNTLKQQIINSGLVDANGVMSAADWNYIIANNPGVTENDLHSIGFSKSTSSLSSETTGNEYNTSFVRNLASMIDDSGTTELPTQPANNSTYYSSPYLQQYAPENTNYLTFNGVKLLNNILTAQKARGGTGITEAEKNELLIAIQNGTINENDWEIIKGTLGL